MPVERTAFGPQTIEGRYLVEAIVLGEADMLTETEIAERVRQVELAAVKAATESQPLAEQGGQ